MAQYINKDTVVKEIHKIYDNDYKFLPSDIVEGVQNFKDDLLMNLDTLEVKEVDLEKEIESSMNNLCELGCYTQSLLDNPEKYEGFAKPFPKEVDDELANFARHFFELGLKTQKGE